MIDYLALLLINMTAGLTLLAAYVYMSPDELQRRAWGPGFCVAGLIALLFGAHITLTWPLTGQFNVAFGETSVLFGIIFLAAGVAMLANWSLSSIAAYAFFAGLAAIVVGVSIFSLRLTQGPFLAAAGFILTGLGGVGALPYLLYLRKWNITRVLAALVILLAAGIWGLTGIGAYMGHMANDKWKPMPMRTPAATETAPRTPSANR